MTQKLTAVAVKNLKPQAGKYEVMDAGNPGFGVWVYPSGAKTYVYAYRCAGRKGRVTLNGPSLAEAREQYRDLRLLVRKGIDPQQQRAEARRQDEQELSFSQLADRYLTEYAVRKRSGTEDSRLLAYDVLPRWKQIKAKEIRRRDVQEMLKAIVDRGAGVTANRTLAVVRKVFNWGIEQDLIEASPCAGVKAPVKEVAEDRVLSDAEITVFWNNLDLSIPIHTALKLELLLAQRIGEILGLRWDELDLDHGIWTLTPERTKNETVHLVPLTAPAIELIEQMRALSAASEYVFASPRRARSGEGEQLARKPIRLDSVGTALSRALVSKGVSHFSSHDLRRTAATNISALGYTDDLIGRILNHKNRTVTGRYNRHSYLPEKREALEAWASRLDTVISVGGCTTVES
jgi:integrase